MGSLIERLHSVCVCVRERERCYQWGGLSFSIEIFMNISRGVLSAKKMWLNLKKSIKNWKCPKEMCDWKCRALSILRMCWCFLSTIEFCCSLSIQGWKEITLFFIKEIRNKKFRCIVWANKFYFDFKLSSN